jgi:hypothetical protein
MAYKFAKRLKILGGLTNMNISVKSWQTALDRFMINPCHHTVGLNIWQSAGGGVNLLPKAVRVGSKYTAEDLRCRCPAGELEAHTPLHSPCNSRSSYPRP